MISTVWCYKYCIGKNRTHLILTRCVLAFHWVNLSPNERILSAPSPPGPIPPPYPQNLMCHCTSIVGHSKEDLKKNWLCCLYKKYNNFHNDVSLSIHIWTNVIHIILVYFYLFSKISNIPPPSKKKGLWSFLLDLICTEWSIQLLVQCVTISNMN